MVSDSELVHRLREVLSTADLNTATASSVRRQLESDLDISLEDKKHFIRDQIDIYLNQRYNANDQDKGEEKEEEEEADVKDEEGREEEEEDEEEKEDEGSGVEEEEVEEDGNGGSSNKRRSSKLNKEVKKRGGGFTKICALSPQLQEFIGETELARTEVVKRLWAYIRENSLQDPSNRRKILCDERLQSLFNVKSIDMFQMNKALSKHIWPLNSEEVLVTSPQKEKQQKKDKSNDVSDESPPKPKKLKGEKSGSGFLKPLQLSDALVEFLGTGESELSRADVIKRIWNYIKENNLQDPADKRKIICDEKLKELFQVDSFVGFTVSKLLVAHFIKSTD